ncbi:MAG: hypothetical protein OXL37_04635 [Chloroflexota bacterium]|nr:hypothetical protein [Chloroflexota bacterium]MDE2960998.1 hypothetical protein [Chloroflexota bacterium]
MTMNTDAISPLSGGPASLPALRWQVWINWAGDGIWGTEDVDISDDVLGLRWDWGRRGLPVPEFAAPASLELTLGNSDHRYTPGNDDGPLGTNVRPGREVRLRVSRLQDDFATVGVGSDDLDQRPATLGDARWEVTATAGNGFAVLDGEARGTAGSFPPSDAVALLDTGDATATLTARYRRTTNGQGGFVLRCVATNDCLRLRFGHASTVLERVSGRITTRLASGSALAPETWHELEIEQTADSVRVHAINLEASDPVGRTVLAANGIADAPVSGRHGLWHSFRNTADRWGDFGVGRWLFRGQVTAISPDYADGTCRIEAADVMQRLSSVRLRRALPGGPMRSGDVAASILAWSGLAPGEHRLDSGRVLLTGGARSVWEVSAARALRRLQREEHGLIYTDGHGRVLLESSALRSGIRAHNDPASLARTAVADTADATGPYASNLRRDDGASATEDAVVFRYQRLVDEGPQRVWNLNEPLAIDAGQERLALAASEAWEAIEGVQTPVSQTDYTATDDAAGTGSDVTDDITVELLSEAASGIGGRGRMLRIRNNGMGRAYVQSLRLSADHCWRAESTTAHRAGDADASAAGTLVNCRYIDNYAAAQAGAEARLGERSVRRAQVEASLPLFAGANARAVVEGRLSDVVELRADAPGISGAWLLEGAEIAAGSGGEGAARWWLTEV